MARPGPVRLAPLQGETNLSYLDRLADRYRLGVRDLIPSLLQVGGGLFKGYRTDGEVYLNAEARARISAFCRVPEEILQRALPAWTAQEPLSPDGAGAAGRFRFGAVVPSAGEGCRLCTAARTGRAKPARVYLQPHTRICRRHRRWMLGTHWIDSGPADTEQVDLAELPQMVAAHRQHRDPGGPTVRCTAATGHCGSKGKQGRAGGTSGAPAPSKDHPDTLCVPRPGVIGRESSRVLVSRLARQRGSVAFLARQRTTT